jgi:hypothetical protein
MGNTVEVSPVSDIDLMTMFFFAINVVLVSLSACLLGSVVMITWWLVRLYGPIRFFNNPSMNIDPNVKAKYLTVSLLLTAPPVVFSAIYRSVRSTALSTTTWLDVIAATVVGIVAATMGLLSSLVVLRLVSLGQRNWTRADYAEAYAPPPGGTSTRISGIVGTSPDLFFPRRLGFSEAHVDQARQHNPRGQWSQRATNFISGLLPEDAKTGYIERDKQGNDVILPGHSAAVNVLAVTLLFYFGIGMLVYTFAYHLSKYTTYITLSFVPTLCYLLLLAMLLCLGLSGLAFYFDRYRIPVLIPLLGVLLIASYFGSDYYYPTIPRTMSTETVENGSAGKQETPAETMIVVAANGGGIQAAAWTAQVLTGLEEECQTTQGCDQDFAKSIRLISSVSGGSIGTMYFVNEYEEDGTLPEKGLEKIVARAEGSSLDHIAWGLLYPDLARTVNILPWGFGLFELDRGQTLDKAWLREDMAWPKRERIQQGLSQWQDDAEAGRRPGVIFNTTIAETGQRLPLSTVPLPEDLPGGIRYKRLLEDIEPKPTIPVVTAARLSAAFPYVSPAARAKKPSEAKILRDGYHEDHIVDGGYYDNYGIASLVEWLDWKLTYDRENIKKVLVIQIIASPSVDDLAPHGEQGWFSAHWAKLLYQFFAPAETVLNVRGAGQSTHSEVELELLKEKWKRDNPCVTITRVPFEFPGEESPLSWHLTKEDKQELKVRWQEKSEKRKQVIRFLTEQGESCG